MDETTRQNHGKYLTQTLILTVSAPLNYPRYNYIRLASRKNRSQVLNVSIP